MKIKSFKIYEYLFFTSLFLFFSDLNGTLSLVFNTRAFLSEIILLITIILFVKSFQIPQKLPSLTKYYIFFYTFFLAFGTLIFYIHGNTIGKPLERIRSLTPSIIIIYSYSKWFLFFISNNKFDKIINVITIALYINTLAIVYSHFSGSIFISDNFSDADRSSGFISSVNQAGTVASMAQAFILYVSLKPNTNKFKRFIYIGLYLISLFAAIVTFSKAAMLKSLLVFLVFLFIFFINLRQQDKVQLSILRRKILFPLLIVLLIIVIGFRERIFSGFSDYQIGRIMDFTQFLKGDIDDKITTNRTSLVEHALILIKQDNFLGRGLDTFHRMEGVGLGTHNQFLLILGETGIIGLVLYIAYYWVLLFKIIKIKQLELKFLGISVIIILIVTAGSMHTMLFTKTMVIMFSLLNVLPAAFLYMNNNNSPTNYEQTNQS